MSKILVIEQEQLDKLFATLLDEVKKLVESQSEQKPTKSEILDAEIANYVILKQAWKLLGITKSQWYDKYQHLISHKSYSGMTWVSKESILTFLKDNVNKKKY